MMITFCQYKRFTIFSFQQNDIEKG